MIRRLHLSNWRSYEDLELSLEPGTTFVVAPNGVGKTSLVCGVAWAVFGQQSGINPRTSIRAGAGSAEVQAQLELPGGRQLTIDRTVKQRGAPTATYTINGASLTEAAALAQLEQALGVDLAVAGRLSTMLGGAHLAAHDALDLESHLHHAFGVSHLLRTAETAESVAKRAERARTELRSTNRRRLNSRAAVESEIAETEAELARLTARGEELEELRRAAAAQQALVERHLAITGELERYVRDRARLISEAENLLGRPVEADDEESVTSDLRTELARANRAVSEATEGAGTARSAISAASEAIDLLNRGSAACPTCMRDLPADQRRSALDAHGAQMGAAEEELGRLERVRKTEQVQAPAVAGLLARIEALEPPALAAEDLTIPSRAEAEASYQQALAALDAHNQELGGARSRLQSLRAQISSDDETRREEHELRMAYRREAAARAGADALREAADRVIESRIEPIAREVRGRWKHLFTNNGLTFKADGTITRVRAGEELEWDTLSGGERTWARIITHLLVMATTTSLPFAWFDEPLEHLDPHYRHAVAATLATATSGGSPRQLLVTTYEHGIAQQLADSTDGARIIAIRESSA